MQAHNPPVSAAVRPLAPPPRLSAATPAPRRKRFVPHGQGAPMKAPRGLPLVGNIPQVRREGMVNFLGAMQKEYGDVFAIKLGPQRAIVVAHPDGLERVLASHATNYIKGKAYDGVRPILGDGLLTLQGQPWKQRRMLIQPSFHRETLGDLVKIMVSSTDTFLTGLKSRFPKGGQIDAHREMVQLTLDVVVNALFGQDLLGADAVPYDVLNDALPVVSERTNAFHLPEFIPTPGNVKYRRIKRELDRAIFGIIEASKKRPAAQGALLSMLLSATDLDTGRPLTDSAVRDEVMTLFVAGHETTALTMTWMFTLLDAQNDVKRRIQEEVDTVLGGRLPEYADYPKLTYTRQVVDEILRLRGPVALVARNAVADDNVMGYAVKGGDMVFPFFWGAHRRAEAWPDPERFDPARFDPEVAAGRDNWSYVPFSAGQRVCIGNTFSLVESVFIIAMLFQRARFSLVPGQNIQPVMQATLRPSAPVHVDLAWT